MTVPVMLKLNGFSSLSLVQKLIWPLLVPAVVASNRTVKVVEPPATKLIAKSSVTVNPVGTPTYPKVNPAVPVFRTVKVRATAAPP